MFRSIRFPLAALAIGLAVTATARAQGWGWLDWGGWTSTPDASLAQGMGHFYHGSGIFNQQTAIADSINADTTMRWNDYLHQVHTESLRRYVARRNQSSARNRAMREAILTRLRDNPEVRDIEMGDALNVAVNQLTDPQISSTALRLANAPISANVIQEIAFRNAAYAVTIVLSQIRDVTKWPAALDTPRFAAEKAEFEAIVEPRDQGRRWGRRGGQLGHSEAGSQPRRRFARKLAAEPVEGNRATTKPRGLSRHLPGSSGCSRNLTPPMRSISCAKSSPQRSATCSPSWKSTTFGSVLRRLLARRLYTAISSPRSTGCATRS